jgi:hypothetical protein
MNDVDMTPKANLCSEIPCAEYRDNLECRVQRLEAKAREQLLQNRELLMALGRAHDPGRCPYNSYGKCWACVALKKYGEQMPDQHLAGCSVCKELIEDTFAARKAAWCEKCEGYSHNNCWAAHNLTYCLKREDECPACNGRGFLQFLEGGEKTTCALCHGNKKV